MAWTTPRTWVTGEAVTSAMFNTHIRDLFQAMAEEPHECWIERTTGVAITTSTLTTVSWEQANRNVGSLWSSGSNVTIREEGLYAVTMNAQWVQATAGYTYCAAQLAGTQIAGRGDDGQGAHNSTQQRSCHAVMRMTASQVVTGVVFHNQGSDLTLQGGVTPGTNLKVVQTKRRLA